MQTDMTPTELEQVVLRCLVDGYGIRGELQRLPGENLNYLVYTDGGERYVLKIVDEDMPAAVVEMENQAISHAISAGVALDFPNIIENLNENIETRVNIRTNGVNRARLQHFIEGEVLEYCTDISEKLLENVGFSLAAFDRAMENFDHPAAHRSHRWNLAEAGRHRPKSELIEDPAARVMLLRAFDEWQQGSVEFERLPSQYIHGDANRENLLVSGDRVVGLVDFGDACFNPAVCELAICLAYIMLEQPDPVGVAASVYRGYCRVRPLSPLEEGALFPLICGRLAVSISVAAQRRQKDPDNPNWFSSDRHIWALLPKLLELGSGRFLAALKSRA
jgi:Ser/Thr protein kinase RdoA (MazF antagonist)